VIVQVNGEISNWKIHFSLITGLVPVIYIQPVDYRDTPGNEGKGGVIMKEPHRY